MKILVALMGLMFGLPVLAQREANVWHFGSYAGVDFSSGFPVAFFNSPMLAGEGCSSICDRNGNLLFFTDGITVWNKNNQPMPNGTGLNGGPSSSQAAQIVAQPGNDSIYYIFTTDDATAPSGLCYSTVNIRQAGGLGAVVQKNSLLQTPVCEKLTAVRHCNNRDVWILAQQANNYHIAAYLLTATGLNLIPIVSNIGVAVNTSSNAGCMKASPNGKKLAIANSGLFGDISLCDFNTGTGAVGVAFSLYAKPSQSITGTVNGHYGVEFSPNSKYLYCTSAYYNGLIDTNSLYHFDATLPTQAAVQNSAIPIYTFNATGANLTTFGALQLGPDKKIYSPMFAKQYLSVVNNPNAAGLACGFSRNAVFLGNGIDNNNFCQYGLPGFVQSYFNDPVIATGNCLFRNVSFSVINPGDVATMLWDFGDPATGSLNTSSAFAPTHLYSDSGLFKVKLVLLYLTGCTDTVYKDVLAGKIRVFVGNDTTLCQGDSLVLKASVVGASYLWSNGSNDTSIKVRQSGNYWVKVRIGECEAIDSINVFFRPLPQFTLGNDTLICNNSNLTIAPSPSYAGSFLWSNGTVQPTATVNTVGNHWLQITDNLGCRWRDTINVQFKTLPNFNLGNDTAICQRDTLLLNAAVTGATGYTWNTGATTPQIKTHQSGIYWCDVDKQGCIYRDSIALTVKPLPAVNLGNDTTVCENTALLLDAQNPGSTYLWNNGSTAQTYLVRQPGMYKVTVTKNNCSSRDSINIVYELLPRFTLGTDRLICPGETIVLQPAVNQLWQLLWQDGSTGSNYSVTQLGLYYLDATARCGTVRDEVLFTKGLCKVYIPNAFTPNGDGRNDVLRVYGTEQLTAFHLQIFNRYGQLVFETRDKNKGWDGRINGQWVNNGGYVYVCRYREQNNSVEKMLKGTVLVIR
jgi:gliding motility-associated-like protein